MLAMLNPNDSGVNMKKNVFTFFFFIVMAVPAANAYDLATEISKNNGKVILSSVGYAKLGLVKISTSSKGMITLNGTISVKGKANIVLWSKVEGNYYFSKLPNLQNIHNQKKVNFKIPFNSAEKTVTEVILEVELKGGGKIEIDKLKLING